MRASWQRYTEPPTQKHKSCRHEVSGSGNDTAVTTSTAEASDTHRNNLRPLAMQRQVHPQSPPPPPAVHYTRAPVPIRQAANGRIAPHNASANQRSSSPSDLSPRLNRSKSALLRSAQTASQPHLTDTLAVRMANAAEAAAARARKSSRF